MPGQEWKGIELAKVSGMSTNPIHPGTNYAKRLVNLHTHKRQGLLTLRPGYDLKYPKPTHSTISDPTYPNFDMFWDRQAVEAGQEITCLLQKGLVSALSGSGVSNTFRQVNFWCRPHWDGTAWTDAWQWINETIITKVTAETDGTYKSMIEIYGGTDHFSEGQLVGYTIYNFTQVEFAKIITSVNLSATATRINHTLFQSHWDVDDVIYIAKTWLGITEQIALESATWDEIHFHRVLHDLRIGSGGYENRPGLAVGYRKNYLLTNEVGFTSVHSDITAAAIEEFAKQDQITLNTSVVDVVGNTYGMNISTTGGGSIPVGKYHFRLTAVMDNYTEQLVAESQIDVGASESIVLKPFMKLGRENTRITSFNLYVSPKDDNTNYYFVRSYNLRANKYEPQNWEIDEEGKMILSDTIQELHSESNAASIASEVDNIGTWENMFGSGTVTSESGGAGGSSLTLKVADGASTRAAMKFPITGLQKDIDYDLDFYVKSDTSLLGFVFFVGASEIINEESMLFLPLTTGFVQKEITLNSGDPGEDITHIGFMAFSGNILPIDIYIDHVSIKSTVAYNIVNSDLVEIEEITDKMGYTPTYSMVEGWDMALSFRGRTYYLNPYLEKRYENFLLVSHIHSNGSFMYDISSFSNYRELGLEGKTIAIALLRSNDLLILKDQYYFAIDPDTGASDREPIYGKHCITKNTVINMHGIIMWNGEEDIYLLNIGSSFVAQELLIKTIRNLYLVDPNKDKMVAIRDKFNTYRLRIYDTVKKTEYLFAGGVPVEEVKDKFAEIYRIDSLSEVNFLNEGDIYTEESHIEGVILDGLGMHILDGAGQVIKSG